MTTSDFEALADLYSCVRLLCVCTTGCKSLVRGQHESLRPGRGLRRAPIEDQPQQGGGAGVYGGVHDVHRLFGSGAEVLRDLLERQPVRRSGWNILCVRANLYDFAPQHTNRVRFLCRLWNSAATALRVSVVICIILVLLSYLTQTDWDLKFRFLFRVFDRNTAR